MFPPVRNKQAQQNPLATEPVTRALLWLVRLVAAALAWLVALFRPMRRR